MFAGRGMLVLSALSCNISAIDFSDSGEDDSESSVSDFAVDPPELLVEIDASDEFSESDVESE